LDDTAFAKFERLREKVERAEAEAEALSELSSDALLPAEVAASSESLEVEAELESLKRELAR